MDGSRYNPNVNPNRTAERLAITNQYYETRTDRYITGTELNPVSMAELTAILELAKANDLTVIGFTQPYHPMFAERLRDNPEFAYRELAITAINSLFETYHFPFYQFPDMTSYAGTVDDFLDDWHYNPIASHKIFSAIAEKSPDILGAYVNTEKE